MQTFLCPCFGQPNLPHLLTFAKQSEPDGIYPNFAVNYPAKHKKMNSQALQRIRKFSFPLDVYAYLLVKESGAEDVFNLHFGWFDNASEPIAQAQERASREFLAQIPETRSRILEVGSGVGTTLSLLIARGHDACGITPDGSQIEFMRDRYGKDFPVRKLRFEDVTPELMFDALIFQESGQYIPLSALFFGAARLLQPGGTIFMCDEFLMGDAEGGELLHSIRQLKSVAAAHGFVMVEEHDLSARASPTMDFILAATSKHRQDLLGLLGVSDEQIDGLDESNKKYQRKYASGKYGYLSLCLRLAK